MDVLDVCSSFSVGDKEKLSADFIGRGNLWIHNVYDAYVTDLARYAFCEAIFKTAPGQLPILG